MADRLLCRIQHGRRQQHVLWVAVVGYGATWGESVAEGFQFCLKFPATSATIATGRGGNRDATIRRIVAGAGPVRLSGSVVSATVSTLLGPSVRRSGTLPAFVTEAVRVRCRGSTRRLLSGRGLGSRAQRDAGELQIDRCLFDSRALFSAPPRDQIERESQRRKPRSPFRTTVTGTRPMLRFGGATI